MGQSALDEIGRPVKRLLSIHQHDIKPFSHGFTLMIVRPFFQFDRGLFKAFRCRPDRYIKGMTCFLRQPCTPMTHKLPCAKPQADEGCDAIKSPDVEPEAFEYVFHLFHLCYALENAIAMNLKIQIIKPQ